MSYNKFSDLSLLELPDCIALSDKKTCNRLIHLICEESSCPFKSTYEEEMDSVQRVYSRLASLENSEQIYIAEKYYEGNMPWNKK